MSLRADSITSPKMRKMGQRRLTDEQVATIRAMRSGGAKYCALGELFGVSSVAIYKICKGLLYAETHPAPDENLRAEARLYRHRRYRRLTRTQPRHAEQSA